MGFRGRAQGPAPTITVGDRPLCLSGGTSGDVVTSAIESLNSVIRKATKKRKLFPNDDAALKVVYLAVNQASRKWTMPIQNWKLAPNRFNIEFGDRVTDHL